MSGISVDVERLARSAERLDAAGASMGAAHPPGSAADFFGSWAEESGAPQAFERVVAELRGRLGELSRSVTAAGAGLRAAGERYAALEDGHAAEQAGEEPR